jgi:hypothetical protein
VNSIHHCEQVIRKNKDFVSLNVDDVSAIKMSGRLGHSVRGCDVCRRRHDDPAAGAFHGMLDFSVAGGNNNFGKSSGLYGTAPDVFNHWHSADIEQRLAGKTG